MTTRQLYYLVTIADQGSLSGASRVLGISQPALSKFLSEYESSLGFLLFLRYHRQLTQLQWGVMSSMLPRKSWMSRQECFRV